MDPTKLKDGPRRMTVRIASRQVPSRRAFWPSTYEAELRDENGRGVGRVRGAESRDEAKQRAERLAARRGYSVDQTRIGWY